jgi:hypothetical protein
MKNVTMLKRDWINLQQLLSTDDEFVAWYDAGKLPTVYNHIGDYELVDLEFASEKDYMWFLLKWG